MACSISVSLLIIQPIILFAIGLFDGLLRWWSCHCRHAERPICLSILFSSLRRIAEHLALHTCSSIPAMTALRESSRLHQ